MRIASFDLKRFGKVHLSGLVISTDNVSLVSFKGPGQTDNQSRHQITVALSLVWVRSPLKEKEVEQRGRTRDKQKRRQEERTGDNYIHKHFIFRCIMSSCCEPHWLCVLWALDNEPAG